MQKSQKKTQTTCSISNGTKRFPTEYESFKISSSRSDGFHVNTILVILKQVCDITRQAPVCGPVMIKRKTDVISQ